MNQRRQIDLFARAYAEEPVVAPTELGHLVHFGTELPARPPSSRPHLDDYDPDTWLARILELMRDRQPRTFQAIMLALAEVTAVQACGSNAERGLWLAVQRQLLEHTRAAPVVFRATASGAIYVTSREDGKPQRGRS